MACLDEAIQLRRCYIHCPILILGHSGCEDAETLVFYDVMPGCFDYELAEAMSKAAIRLGKHAKIHIKIDTGMGRVGYRFADDETACRNTVSEILRISKLPNIEINGIFTHFSVADDDDDEYTFFTVRQIL